MRRIVVALLVLLVASEAAADDPLARPTEPRARKHLEDGEAFYNQQKWDEAIVEFEKGALLAPELPVWYLALGQAHRQAGRYDRARWHYERFLSKVEGDPEAEDAVAMVRSLIDDMNTAQNRPPTEAAPTEAPRVVRRPAGMTASRKAAIGVGVGGLVALGAGAAFGIRANGFKDDAARICPSVSCERAAEANELLDRGRSNALYANIAYGVGAAALVGAAVLWVTGGPSDDGPSHTARGTVSVQFSPAFAGIDVRMRF